jgi:hypothetical protein
MSSIFDRSADKNMAEQIAQIIFATIVAAPFLALSIGVSVRLFFWASGL